MKFLWGGYVYLCRDTLPPRFKINYYSGVTKWTNTEFFAWTQLSQELSCLPIRCRSVHYLPTSARPLVPTHTACAAGEVSRSVTLGMNAPLKCTSLWIKPSIDFSWSERLEETLATVFWRACSVVSNNSLQPHGRQPTRILRHVIFQARILEWVVISYPRGSSQPRDRTHISCICRRILYHWA